jgi:membrane protein DedA with SNARE-associated domain
MHIETTIQTVGYPAVFILAIGECMGIPLPGENGLLAAAVIFALRKRRGIQNRK